MTLLFPGTLTARHNGLMTSDQAGRRSRRRSLAAWGVATVSIVLAMLFVGLLIRDPAMIPAWIGLACFTFSAVGAIVTVELERRSRRGQTQS